MSDSGKCVEQNKLCKVDTTTCIRQANELLLHMSAFTYTLVITLLKRARIPGAVYTKAHTRLSWHLLSSVTVTADFVFAFHADC